jgi:hypothetical protein
LRRLAFRRDRPPYTRRCFRRQHRERRFAGPRAHRTGARPGVQVPITDALSGARTGASRFARSVVTAQSQLSFAKVWADVAPSTRGERSVQTVAGSKPEGPCRFPAHLRRPTPARPRRLDERAGTGPLARLSVACRSAGTRLFQWPTSVRKALPRLSATAEIEPVDGKHVVVDPLFAEWIERINQGSPAAVDESA